MRYPRTMCFFDDEWGKNLLEGGNYAKTELQEIH